MKLLVVLFAAQVALAAAADSSDYFTLSAEEKAKVVELRGLVAARISESYMKEDDYLLRFLRDKDMSVGKAHEMFVNMLSWRTKNKVDTILTETNEDFTRFDGEFPGDIEGCDMKGRPIVAVKASDGDVAKEVAKTKGDILKRYTIQTLEKATAMLRRMNKEGEKISQVVLLADLDGFSVASHANPACIGIYLDLLNVAQANYPGYINKIIAINTPSYAMPVWDAYKSKATQKLRDTVIIKTEKKDWEPYLKGDGEMAMEERTSQYGGTKEKGLPLLALYKSDKAFKCKAPMSEYGL